MHFLIKWKKSLRLLLTIGMLFCLISVLILQNYSLIKENQRIFEKDNIDSPTLKISDYWNNINFIHINNDNWSSTDVDWIQNRTGMWDDPHIIENITINGGGSGSCIIIENSNEFFIIRNCTVYNSGPLINQQTLHYDAGIKLVNTSNGLIMNNNCSDTMVGIIVGISFNITISRNAVTNNKWGIRLLFSNNITISENNLKDNDMGVGETLSNNINITKNTINNNSTGIFLNNGYNNTLSGNNMTECGLLLTGNQEEISSHVVDDTNLVNGNLLYYLINENSLGKDNFTNPGQIILINCNDSLITDLSISHATCGIFLYYCDNNTIQNNNISHCSVMGIGLWFCSDFTVSKNLMIHCGFFATGTPGSFYSHNFTSNLVNEKAVYYYINETGLGKDNFTNPGQIFLINCSDSLVSDLNVSYTTMGIALISCTNNIIFNITASHNIYGIMMGFSYDNSISENILNNNANNGIYFSLMLNNTIINNTINENGIGIEFSDDCYNNTIAENSINNNNQGVLMGTYGICENNTLFGNSIENNKNEGIFLRNCNNNTFSGNFIRDNGWCGIISDENCDINRFYGNYFMGNEIHAIEDPLNINYWNNSVVGNFWDDYTSIDADSDGIGDIPHYFMDGVDYLPIWESLIPNIIINYPSDNLTFGSTAPNFEVLIKDETIALLKNIVHIDTMWYTLDGGETNYTFITNGTINQAALDVLPEGLVTLRFYANDTLGNLGSETVIIFKDTIAPDITIHSPEPNQVFASDAPEFNLIIVDDSLINSTWYTIDGGETNYTFITNGTINQAAWDVLPEGLVTLRFYANNTLGNLGSETVIIFKDTIAPDITIHSPEPNQVFASDAPEFNLIIVDNSLINSTWYTIDGGETNFIISGLTGTINQNAWNSASQGEILIMFYAEDITGNIGTSVVTVIKSIPSQPFIPGYNMFIIIGTFLVFIAIVCIYRIKRRPTL